MMDSAQFFPDEEAYRAWVQRLPAVTLCREEAASRHKPEDLHDPGYSTTSGPYYVSPEHLILLVGSAAASSRFVALRRVSSEAEADVRWFVPGAEPNQDGETTYAAYVRDTRTRPATIVGGETPRQAREALVAFLAETTPARKR